MSISRGLYRHTASGKLYNVIGVGRAVENPAKLLVVYEQMYDSNLKGTNIPLSKGSIWTRGFEDFHKTIDKVPKFVKVDDELFRE
jgi:hypothetical protein